MSIKKGKIKINEVEWDANLVLKAGKKGYNELSFIVMGDTRSDLIIADRDKDEIISKLSFHQQVQLVKLLKKNLLMDD